MLRHLFIAFCALTQGLVTYKLLQVKPNWLLLLFLFCSTFFIYKNGIFFLCKNRTTYIYKGLQQIFCCGKAKYVTACTCFFLVASGLQLHTSTQLLAIVVGWLSIAYYYPIIVYRGEYYNLRSLPWIKGFLISLVWSLSCVLLPILELKSEQSLVISNSAVGLLLASRFFFIAALSLPFDLRDMSQDRAHNIQTIPMLLGEDYTRWLAIGLLFFSVSLLTFSPILTFEAIPLACSVIMTSILICSWTSKRKSYYYLLLLDGMLAVQYLFLLI